MLSNKFVVFAAIAVALSVSLVLFVLVRDPKNANLAPGAGKVAFADTSAVPEMASVQRELGELRRAFKKLERRSTQVENDVASLATDLATDKADPVVADRTETVPAPATRSVLETHFRYADGYRAFAASENRDPIWARDKEAELQQFFDAKSFKDYSLTSVECRQTVCTIELQSEGAADPAENPDTIRQHLGRKPFAEQSYWAPTEHGVVVVLSREGEELPSPTSLGM